MKLVSITIALAILVSIGAAAGLASARGGVGVCVLGNGLSVRDLPVSNYAGVNLGQNSTTGVFTTQASYEAECCAEVGREPNCFRPVQ